ncbi:hypothetical protein D3C85_1552310 [compost metagenome]
MAASLLGYFFLNESAGFSITYQLARDTRTSAMAPGTNMLIKELGHLCADA